MKMKKSMILIGATLLALTSYAQSCYWVFFADKGGTTFDPYAYFDAKAVERYALNGADLWDSTNYPVQPRYAAQVEALVDEAVGESRWLNALGVVATDEQMALVSQLPFVSHTALIATRSDGAGYASQEGSTAVMPTAATDEMPRMHQQLLRMQGDRFRSRGIDGTGIRVAVFDGGFPSVDTHPAFRHLRDNHQIVATYNFPDKRDDVYGWNTHGTMVLSCIAGRTDALQMGLATGSTFLLARTEIEPEPFKEEVWWCMAVEWADKHGADVVNSSLGYGKDRYYTTQMDGRSYVAHAANLAARKGILVCNSAGNEGDDGSWRTIITPGDADSILTVGGIEASLTDYSHIDFSSYGPTADGRLKPNVCNFGQAVVAQPGEKGALTTVYGTSFSSPLTAGFCACAWQTRRHLTAMQMKEAVEHAADLYPYFDYAYGYGVPQASYFLDEPQPPAARIEIGEEGNQVVVRLTPTADSNGRLKQETGKTLFVKYDNGADSVYAYSSRPLQGVVGTTYVVRFDRTDLVGKRLTLHFDGQTASHRLSPQADREARAEGAAFDPDRAVRYTVTDAATGDIVARNAAFSQRLTDNQIGFFRERIKWGVYVDMGSRLHSRSDELAIRPYAPSWRVGANLLLHVKRSYAFGLGLEWGRNRYRLAADETNIVDDQLGLTAVAGDRRRQIKSQEWSVELFQRVRFMAGGLTHHGFFWDLGLYGSHGSASYLVRNRTAMLDGSYRNSEQKYSLLALSDACRWNWGLTTRLVYNYIGLYGRYRLGGSSSTITPATGSTASTTELILPRFELGLVLYL
ncbi:MAG: S8 family serine peptidase [Bacteroidales bacterium]|nr:S8 family serine peptidase [Bacteroidales bacterium]